MGVGHRHRHARGFHCGKEDVRAVLLDRQAARFADVRRSQLSVTGIVQVMFSAGPFPWPQSSWVR
ncbi:hypothetical protein XMIN_1531 [Xanthomonas citri pv. mangiferaeindicae LMG 941]|nr:hypothetical protein XMIN_1531 [Xanthomonas citri pv. mangiferaeindicae LMG 941]